MKTLLKSKLYQQEIMRWAVTLGLAFWAITTSVLALQNRKEILLVGINEKGHAKLIVDMDDQFLQQELRAFLLEFLSLYYSYNEATFDERIVKATELLSEELWNEKKAELLGLSQKLKKEPLSQRFEIKALDLIGEDKVEALLSLEIRQRASTHQITLKVSLELVQRERSYKNPWGFEIKELSSVVL